MGYLVVDADSGETVASLSPDRSYPPASTAKVPTMIAALEVLGPTHRFATSVMAHGVLKAGVITGDLILTGNGDPLLTAGDLKALVVRLSDFGVTRLDGRFLYESALPQFPLIEPTQPLDAPYNQGVGGLSLDFNRVSVTPRADGEIWVTPQEAAEVIPASGKVYALAQEQPVRDPARLAALMLKRFAGDEGIALPAPEEGRPPPGSVTLAQIQSQSLVEIARAGLEYSNNMVAEALGLATAQQLGATPRSLAESALKVGLWLEREVPNLSRFAQNLQNHSGLSTESAVTPRQMTALLRYALSRRYDGWRFDALLAPGGAREGFHSRFRAPTSAFKIWAKSGTMHYIKGLVGYMNAGSGRRLIFAMFTTDPVQRTALDARPRPIDGEARAAAEAWRLRAERLEEIMITRWISSY